MKQTSKQKICCKKFKFSASAKKSGLMKIIIETFKQTGLNKIIELNKDSIGVKFTSKSEKLKNKKTSTKKLLLNITKTLASR